MSSFLCGFSHLSSVVPGLLAVLTPCHFPSIDGLKRGGVLGWGVSGLAHIRLVNMLDVK